MPRLRTKFLSAHISLLIWTLNLGVSSQEQMDQEPKNSSPSHPDEAKRLGFISEVRLSIAVGVTAAATGSRSPGSKILSPENVDRSSTRRRGNRKSSTLVLILDWISVINQSLSAAL